MINQTANPLHCTVPPSIRRPPPLIFGSQYFADCYAASLLNNADNYPCHAMPRGQKEPPSSHFHPPQNEYLVVYLSCSQITALRCFRSKYPCFCRLYKVAIQDPGPKPRNPNLNCGFFRAVMAIKAAAAAAGEKLLSLRQSVCPLALSPSLSLPGANFEAEGMECEIGALNRF